MLPCREGVPILLRDYSPVTSQIGWMLESRGLPEVLQKASTRWRVSVPERAHVCHFPDSCGAGSSLLLTILRE